MVLTLLAYGSPTQAIVAAFGLDERTVSRWQKEAGSQCRRVHEHLVEAGNVELSQVQADELRVRVVGGVMWLATALEVKSRLWLGGVVRVHRDRQLIGTLLWRIRECGSVAQILLCTDGLACYAKQALLIFREAWRTGRLGRPRLMLPEGVMVARVKKRYERRRVVEVVREVVRGAEAAVQERLMETQRSITALINTAYVERLNATFRARLAPLVRRTRAGVHKQATPLEAGMWLLGTCYNFVWLHRSLRQERGGGDDGEELFASKWIERTPAQAAGLTDHRWTLEELMSFVVVPARIPKRRGRRPKWLLEAARAA